MAPILLDRSIASRTLETVQTSKTRLEREFDPRAILQLKAQSARDIAVGGTALAAHAIRAGLVDEYHLFLAPSVVGGGYAFFKIFRGARPADLPMEQPTK